jgi:aromatic-L-amino-acid decarboxylase
MTPPADDLPAEEFRRAAHEAVDWIADYLRDIRQRPVLPSVEPGDLIDALPRSGPERGEAIDAILEDFRALIVPGLTNWNHPRFLAWFANTGSCPGILGEMLAAAVNVNGMLWKSSPAATELEQVTLSWLRQWLGLPDEFFGIIYDTASMSSLHALAAARELAAPETRVEGTAANLTLYVSEQAHNSIEKDALTLGIGQRNVRKVPADDEFRMKPEVLAAMIEEDRAAGRRPFCVVATVGTTSTASVDPVIQIADIAERYGLWLHVDGAYGGAAAVVPEMRRLFDGWERADSIVVNPHKWLLTPMDLSVFYTRRPEILRRAFALEAAYLESSEGPRALNYSEYGVQLGRRFRALKLWFVLRFFGREGLIAILREHIRLAGMFAGWIGHEPDFELAAPSRFSLVCFRARRRDEFNRRLLARVNATRELFLSGTVIHGRFALRLAIGNIRTSEHDIERVRELLGQALAELDSEPAEPLR